MNSEERASTVVGWLSRSEVDLNWVERNREGIPHKGHNMSKGESIDKIFTDPNTSLEYHYNIKYTARLCVYRNEQKEAVGTVERLQTLETNRPRIAF